MLKELRDKLRKILTERSERQAELDAIVSGAEERGDDLTDEEQATFRSTADSIRELDERRSTLEARIAELEAADEARSAAEAAEARLGTVPEGATGSPAIVRNEERTYSEATDFRDGVSFFRDVVNAQVRGDRNAADRLFRHAEEERREGVEVRAVGTGAFAGTTVPQYLLDMVAPKKRAMRPFADICNSHPLPSEGMTVEISRGTTGTSAAAQDGEGTSVSETDMDDTLLSVPVRTVAGQQTISIQALSRSRGADQMVITDLAGAYHSELDRQLIEGTGSNGQHTGVRVVSGGVGVTYTDASPTAAELWPKLFELIAGIAAGHLGASHFVMHSRRFWWLVSNVGPNFPFVQTSPENGRGGTADAPMGAGGPQGILAGLPAIVDNNVPTDVNSDQDPVIAVAADECHLWEDGAPLQVQVEKPATLQVELALYGFSAFTCGRYPLATGEITGTGVTTPTF